MKTKYKTVDTSTMTGIKQAEALHSSGWKMGSVGFYTIQFYKKEENNVKKN